MPFDDLDDDSDEAYKNKKKLGAKLNKKPEPVAVPKFEEKAKEVFEKEQYYKSKIFELVTKFSTILKDKTLPENKTELVRQVEGEVISNLIELAQEMNSDDYTNDGEGSNALINLLFKVVVSYKDKLNSLEFRIRQLEENERQSLSRK